MWMRACTTYKSRWAVKAYQLTWHFSSFHGHDINPFISSPDERLTNSTISASSSSSSNRQLVWHIIGSYVACLLTSTTISSLGHGRRWNGFNTHFLGVCESSLDTLCNHQPGSMTVLKFVLLYQFCFNRTILFCLCMFFKYWTNKC